MERHESQVKLKTAGNADRFARKWRRHLRFWPLFWSLTSAFLFCLSMFLGWPLLWQGLLLMIPLMVTTTGLGWLYGISLIPLGLLMVWGSQLGAASSEPWWFYFGTLSLLLLGVISGQSLFSLWRASERRAKRAAKREQLLSSTVRQLQKARSTEAIYEILPDILSNILTFTHSSVFVPHGNNLRLVAAHNWKVQPGLQVPLRSVIGRAYQQATSQYVADTSQDPHFCKAPNAPETYSELALPLSVEGVVIAVLNIEYTKRDAFSPDERATLETFANMAEEALLHAQTLAALEQNVITDSLTGLGNRKGFNQQLELGLADAHRYERPLSLIMMDLNNFKEINDIYGHQAGDEALRTIADTIRQERRQSDALYRWGGDEFALILAETDRQGAQLAAKRYAAAVATLNIGRHPLSFSIGVASFPEDGETSEQLLKKADERMYQHKALA